ncbi:UPAR/Ly6 domain-containing protein cold-like [Lineus longissimus]|uniref:UPAR/Ly6 domain-containing protein cold-like n=1 Tax=Lineus longissimus TaxID=88925 RepID=UPI002B4C6066
MDKILVLGVLLAVISGCFALECYVCKDQDGNKDKCVKSTIQCDQHDDTCMTTIRYRVPPFWLPKSDSRRHFVSKTCVKQEVCEETKYSKRKLCKRDWYDDWTCVECCRGDLCNYYVTLGSGTVQGSLLITLFTAITVLVRSFL